MGLVGGGLGVIIIKGGTVRVGTGDGHRGHVHADLSIASSVSSMRRRDEGGGGPYLVLGTTNDDAFEINRSAIESPILRLWSEPSTSEWVERAESSERRVVI